MDGDLTLAKVSLIATDVWQWTPFVTLLMLAGLQSVPGQLYEAASLDRASAWMVFTRITLPFLRIPILLALLFRTIDTFKFFEAPYIITQGGPGDLTESLSLMAYNTGFEQSLLGMGAAISWLMLIVIYAIAWFLVKALTHQRRRAEEVMIDPNAPVDRRIGERAAMNDAPAGRSAFQRFIWYLPALVITVDLCLPALLDPADLGQAARPDSGLPAPLQVLSGLGQLPAGFRVALSRRDPEQCDHRGRQRGPLGGAGHADRIRALALFASGRRTTCSSGFSRCGCLPAIAVIIPYSRMVRWVNLEDTHLAMIMIYAVFNISFSVWLLKGFFDEIPRELEEAAIMDGYGPWAVFGRVALPLVIPGLATALVFSMILSLNEFLLAFVLTRTRRSHSAGRPDQRLHHYLRRELRWDQRRGDGAGRAGGDLCDPGAPPPDSRHELRAVGLRWRR